jgi:hypothetical protein
MMTDKIRPEHLTRRALVYIRQSTPGQVRHNLESQRRQYDLANKARAMGWHDVDVIDGISVVPAQPRRIAPALRVSSPP